jgi:hypothetical protein
VSGEVPDFAIVGPSAPGQPAVVVGDTRDMDGRLLRDHPELHAIYAQWAGRAALEHALKLAGATSPDSDQTDQKGQA